MSNRLEQIVNLKLNNFEIKVPIAKGKKPAADQAAEEDKKLGNPYGEYAEYPWDKCIADQLERYGDEEIAKKVCGAIKAGMKSNFQEGDDLEGSCWPGYTAIGLKPSADGTRMVPNCVKDEQQSKSEFVIPKPEGNEDENAFISRCMSELNAEFPDESQRAAVCYKSWRGE